MGPTPNKEPRARLGALRERRAQGTAEKGGSRATGGRETFARSATTCGALLPGRRIRGGAIPRPALSSGSVDRGARGPVCPGRRDRAPGLCLGGLRGVRAGGVRRREGRAREGRAGARSGRAGDRLRDGARRQRKAPFRRTGRRGGGPRGRFGGAGGKRRGGRGGGRIPNGSGEPGRKKRGGPRR
jgi:hypothetical protein